MFQEGAQWEKENTGKISWTTLLKLSNYENSKNLLLQQVWMEGFGGLRGVGHGGIAKLLYGKKF